MRLLDRIAAERDAKVATRTLRRERPLAPVGDRERPYLLPASWVWARLGSVLVKLTDGTHHSPVNSDSGDFPYISAKNVKDGFMDLTGLTFVTAQDHATIWARCDPSKGDVLFVKDGATTGNAALVELDTPFSMLSSVALLRPGTGLDPRYLLLAMRSPALRDLLRVGMTGSAITRTTLAKMKVLPVPIPPVVEQQRIVDRVEELMRLCDVLEEQAVLRRRMREALTSAALHEVVRLDGDHEFRRALRAFADNIEVHLAAGDGDSLALRRFRQAILDLAVRGRLTHQDQEDEPAAELLRCITGERNRLVKAKKIRKPKQFGPIEHDGRSFILPSGWTLARGNEFFLAADSGWSPQCLADQAGPGEWGVLKTSAVSRGIFEGTENKKLPASLQPRAELEIHPGDFVMIRASGSKDLVGRGAIVTETGRRLMLSDKHIRLRFLSEVSARYWAILNNSTDVQSYYAAESSGTSTMSNGQVHGVDATPACASEDSCCW